MVLVGEMAMAASPRQTEEVTEEASDIIPLGKMAAVTTLYQ